MELYCDYDQTSYNVGGHDQNDEWSRDSSEGDYWVTGVRLSGGFRDVVESAPGETFKEGDEVHVVYVVYTTGDTFGSDGGHSSLLVATKDIEIALAAEAWAKKVNDFGTCDEEWARGMKSPPYPAWVGYFERLDAVRIFSGVVQA
jgi:hypothetical protein